MLGDTPLPYRAKFGDLLSACHMLTDCTAISRGMPMAIRLTGAGRRAHQLSVHGGVLADHFDLERFDSRQWMHVALQDLVDHSPNVQVHGCLSMISLARCEMERC